MPNRVVLTSLISTALCVGLGCSVEDSAGVDARDDSASVGLDTSADVPLDSTDSTDSTSRPDTVTVEVSDHEPDSDRGRDDDPAVALDSDSQPDDGTLDDPVVNTGRDVRPPPEGWCQTTDTVLGAQVTTLSERGWAELPGNDSLDALPLHNHLVTWRDTAVWNPLFRTVQWVGSPGSCCADPAAYVLITYEVETDTWTVSETPWGDAPGHAYDGNALDPATGVHYFARGPDVRGFNGETWTRLPSLPFSGPVAPAITWFGAANAGEGALVYVGRSRRVALYEGSDWEDISRGTDGWGNYHMFAEYNPIDQVVWLGAGNEGTRRHNRLEPDLTYTQLADAPVSLNVNGDSFKTYDPLSGLFLVRDNDNHRWWEFDVMADRWTEVSSDVRAGQPESWDPDANFFGTAIDECGVFFFFTHEASERRAYVYRHSR